MDFNCKTYIGCNCDAQESDSVWLDIPLRSHVSPRRMQWTTKRDAQKNKNIPVRCNFSQALSNHAAPQRISQSGNWERCLTFFTRFYVGALLIIDHTRLRERKNPIFWEQIILASLRAIAIKSNHVPAIQIDINIRIKYFSELFPYLYFHLLLRETAAHGMHFVGIVNLMLLSS